MAGPLSSQGESTPNFGIPENRRILRTQSMQEVTRSPDPPIPPEIISFPARPSPPRSETPAFISIPNLNEDETVSFPAKANLKPQPKPKPQPQSEPNLQPNLQPIQRKNPSKPSEAKKEAVHAKEEAKEGREDEIAKEDDELNELINSLHSSVSGQEKEGPDMEIQNVWDQKIKQFQELQRRKQKALREVGKAGEESVVGRGERMGRRNN